MLCEVSQQTEDFTQRTVISKTKRGLVFAPTFKKDGDARRQALPQDEIDMYECLQSVFSHRNVWHQVGHDDVFSLLYNAYSDTFGKSVYAL